MSNTVDAKLALKYCLALLAKKEYSASELYQKLINKEFSADLAEDVIFICQQNGWQSDSRTAAILVHSYVTRQYGPRYIEQKLKLKQISLDLIKQEYQNQGVDWCAVGIDLLTRKFKNIAPDDFTTKKKAYSLLAYRGFYQSDITETLHQFISNK